MYSIRLNNGIDNVSADISFFVQLTGTGLRDYEGLLNSEVSRYRAEYKGRWDKAIEHKRALKLAEAERKRRNQESIKVAEKLRQEKEQKAVKETEDTNNNNDVESALTGVNAFKCAIEAAKKRSQESKTYVAHGVFIEDFTTEKEETQASQLPGDIEYVQHGYFLEDFVTKDDNVEMEVQVPVTNAIDNKDYVEHGTFLEDITTKVNKETETKRVHLEVSTSKASDNKEYVPHGAYLEDFIAKTTETKEECLKNPKIHEVYSEEVGRHPVQEEHRKNSETHEVYSEEVGRPPVQEDTLKRALVDKEGSLQTKKLADNNVNRRKKIVEETLISEIPEKKVETVSVVHTEDIPRDVKMYVKKHKGCTLSEVKKYYSMKEIQRAISFGKIQKRGDKLWV